MKTIKSLSAVLICVCLIAAMFVGCSPKVSLEGKWETTIDLSKEANEGLDMSQDEDGEYFGVFNESLTVNVYYTFDSDNNYTVSVNEEQFRPAFDAYMEKYVDYVLEGTYKTGEAEGLSREDFDDFYMESEGKTLREALVDELKLDNLYASLIKDYNENTTQQTIVDKDRFYITDNQGNKINYESFTLEGDKLTINGLFDMNDNPVEDELYPLTFTKVA
ncbi:MAG: hypothetical protein K2H13_03905 [Eubacterium sp.]|nr:hypothetical protein [Eubacterium sp.]MDE6155738.1 hypothetical protein [Eubacterium sp.]